MKLSDIVFYNHGRGPSDGNNYWKRVTIPHFIFVCATLVLLGVCVGFVGLAVTASYLNGWLGENAFSAFMGKPLIPILNILPCVLLVLLFYFATGRAWAAFLFPALIVYTLTVLNAACFFFHWLALRPGTFSKTLTVLFNGVSDTKLSVLRENFFNLRLLLIPGSLIVGTLLSVFLMPGVLRGKARLWGVLACVTVCVVVMFTVMRSSALYERTQVTVPVAAGPEDLDYLSRGFLYPLLHGLMGG